jgi:hypothetical protein
VAPEHRDDHREPLRIDPGGDAARHRQVGARDERLHLEHERSRPLERTREGRAGLLVLGPAEEERRVLHAREPGRRHLEDAQLVRRAEAVLDGAEDAVRAIPVALEL